MKKGGCVGSLGSRDRFICQEMLKTKVRKDTCNRLASVLGEAEHGLQ